jgi:hypothetical protein
MALSIEPFGHVYISLAVASRWLAVNAPVLLIVIYLAVFFCGALLALHVGRISQKVGQLRREVARQAVLLKRLMDLRDARSATRPSSAERFGCEDAQFDSDRPATPTPTPADTARVRSEIQSVLAEMRAERET